MIRINQTLCVAFVSMVFMACNKDKGADSPDNMDDGSAERTGEDMDEASEDVEESFEEAGEDMEDAAEEVEDEVDGDPTTD